MSTQSLTKACAATGKQYPARKLVPLVSIRPNVADVIRKQYPDLPEQALVGTEVVNAARIEYVRTLLTGQLGELTKLDEEVITSLHNHEIVSDLPDEDEEDARSTFGERLSDKIAEFGGSWTFIITFASVMAVWIILNAVFLANKGFDPYPFILLNLLLSCLAAMQAPVIMMSQNRQELRDRRRAENDYKVNLKAELEIRHLHEKIDYLLHQQATRLMEIQQIQLEAMQDAVQSREKLPKA
ncbi:MAG: DUF1003 domain-containing protein [Luteolibacter sp.]